MAIEDVRGLLAGGVAVTPGEGLQAIDPGADGEDPGYDGGIDGFDPPAPPVDALPDDAPPEARCVGLPLNDFGNGSRLLVHFGEDLLHVSRVGWFCWDGTRFTGDPDGIAVRRHAHQLTDLIGRGIDWMPLTDPEARALDEADEAELVLAELGAIKPSDRSDAQIAEMARASKLIAAARDIKDRRDKSIGRRLTHAKNAGNTNAIKNLMTEAAAVIARPLDDLDADPLVVNTLGGVLRFALRPGEDQGGQFAPLPVCEVTRFDHDRAQLLTKVMPVEYDRHAKAPVFQAFLERVQPVVEMRGFLQRWFGYSMLGLTAEQKFAFLYGSGANGKSVLVDLMAKIMGDYAASAKIGSITGKSRRGGGDATPDLVPLIGARFVRTSEPDEGTRLQEGLIKELTGGEPILVRALNENFVLVYPIFKLTISGNHRPEIHGGDDGIWRRVMLVPFDVQIPPDERDPEMGAKLWAERAGVLNWLVEGARQYLAHGLQVPSTVTAATDEYREDSDPLATFLTLCCAVTGRSTDSIRAKDLTDAFNLWMDEGGRGVWTERTVFKRIKSKSERWKHPASGQVFTARKASESYYDGLCLVEPFRARFEEWQATQVRLDLRRQSDAML